jgi:concanavalin A-like lectin/glucanase superfamily protein
VATRVLWLAATVCAASCAFRVAGNAGDLAAPVDLAASDLSSQSSSGDDLSTAAAPELAMASPDLAVGFCGEPSLIACYQFEEGAAATVARDGTANHNDLVLTAASEPAGGHAGGALAMSTGANAHVAHNATLDPQQLTIEMWVKPASLPPGGARMGLLDEDGEYGLFIYSPGALVCSAGGVTLSSAGTAITSGNWQHVACTYDGAMLRIYRDGSELANTVDTGTITSGQPNGMSVGCNSPSNDDLDGLVDDVRLFGVARSAQKICNDAGRTTCF